MRVYIFDVGVIGEVVSLGAHVSTVRYNHLGLDYEVIMENNEFAFMEDDEVD